MWIMAHAVHLVSDKMKVFTAKGDELPAILLPGWNPERFPERLPELYALNN